PKPTINEPNHRYGESASRKQCLQEAPALGPESSAGKECFLSNVNQDKKAGDGEAIRPQGGTGGRVRGHLRLSPLTGPVSGPEDSTSHRVGEASEAVGDHVPWAGRGRVAGLAGPVLVGPHHEPGGEARGRSGLEVAVVGGHQHHLA